MRRATVRCFSPAGCWRISIHALLAESDASTRIDTDNNFDFYPRSPCGERPSIAGRITSKGTFLSTLSLRRATSIGPLIFNVQPPFLSTLSLRRATCVCWMALNHPLFLSTLSLRRATVKRFQAVDISARISIHALLAESDWPFRHCWNLFPYFYPRSPCGERLMGSFRSGRIRLYFYPRSPCGERRLRALVFTNFTRISIHALLAESDYLISARYTSKAISIHALLAESDLLFLYMTLLTLISIHALLAESDFYKLYGIMPWKIFLSTLSLRRATPIGTLRTVSVRNFYPRSPCGERLYLIVFLIRGVLFLSTLSLRRATPQGCFWLS